MLKLTSKSYRNIKIVLLAIIAISPILAIGYLCYPKSNPKGDLSHRQEAEHRLKAIQERLDKPVTPPPTRYQQLDEAINSYLNLAQSENSTAADAELSKANQIAEEMEAKTGDRWGRDLVDYYRSIDRASVAQLSTARQIRSNAGQLIDLIGNAIKQAKESKAIFERYGARTEVTQTNTLIVSYMVKTDATDSAMKLTDSSLEEARRYHYQFLQADLLRWRSEILSNTSQFNASILALEESLKIATPLEVPQFIVKVSGLLSSTYYFSNENQLAFNQAFNVIKTSTENNLNVPIQAVQVMGMSSFNLNFNAAAESYLKQALTLSEKQHHYPNIVMSYTFYGIVLAEQKRFSEAEEKFTKARERLDKLTSPEVRAYVDFSVTGYQARAKMLAGDVEKSILLYEQTLELAKQTNVQQQLVLSQLHQGLGECMIAMGNKDRAKKELTVSIALARKAQLNNEQSNDLLTFAVTHQSSQQQLDLIETNR